jgi:putative ABC transport system permease protein
LSDSLSNYRSPMILLILFGATALGLAILGLYAVLAYAVSQRAREIGIRIALGAQSRAILALILAQGLRFTLLGVGLGLGVSFGLSRLLRSLLFGVSSNDPFIYFALILTVALLACFLPARRACKVDPIVSLRSE